MLAGCAAEAEVAATCVACRRGRALPTTGLVSPNGLGLTSAMEAVGVPRLNEMDAVTKMRSSLLSITWFHLHCQLQMRIT
jgi:hypothetical protein